MFSYLSPEERVPANHPLRPIRRMVDEALKALSPAFSGLYSAFGRPSIPPEKLLRALLLQVLYTVRSERMLMEQLEYNLLFRWFVGLNMDETVWVPTVFTKNRDRLLEGDIAEKFFAHVLAQAQSANLLSDEHFSVDGTLAMVLRVQARIDGEVRKFRGPDLVPHLLQRLLQPAAQVH
jgi:transposase